MLQKQLRSKDDEKEKLFSKFKTLQDENIDLKTKLFNLKQSITSTNYQTYDNVHKSVKDSEIERLKHIIEELIKSNDDKEKKIDDLNKQVNRFKRIQDLVLTAQNTTKTKEFDDSTSETNSQNDKNISSKTASLMDQPTKNNDKMTNSLVIASSINQACSLISSCSLSSSLSSSSSSSSSTSSASSSQSNTNTTNLQAPLATISELISYNSLNTNSPNSVKLDHYNTLPSKRELETNYRNSSLSKLTSKSCLSSTTSSNTIINEDSDLKDTTSQWIQKETLKLTKNKKGSVSSLNEEHSQLLDKKQSKSNCTSPMHSNNKSLRNFFGKLIRTSLVNINESQFNMSCETTKTLEPSTTVISNKNLFRRGGTRATANARLQNSFSISNSSLVVPNSNEKVASSFFSFNLDTLAFSKLSSTQCYDWLCKNGFEFVKNSDGTYQNKWLKNGLHLLKASKYEYEKELNIKSPLHRKKLSLLLQSMYDKNNINLNDIQLLNCIDYHWVTKWLDDIGLPQYKDVFSDSRIDGLMLNILSIDDLIALNINSELHYLSIKRGIHVLRINNFDTHCLRRRPSGDEHLDKSEVSLWTNHRVMEWLRSIDLSEYAPNLRGSGVHGALMVYEARFNSTVLADILAIPTSKTLLRRHLNTLFCDLIGAQVNQIKLDAESNSSYQPLSASNKLKQTKRIINVGGIFSHKRTKSQDSRDFFSGSISLLNDAGNDDLSSKTKMLLKNYKSLTDNKKYSSQSATLPMNSVVTFCEANALCNNSVISFS